MTCKELWWCSFYTKIWIFLWGHTSKPTNPHWDSPKVVQNRTRGTLKKMFSCFLIIKFFTVNPIIFGEDLTAQHIICWNITTHKSMDVKLLHPVCKDFLDTVNTVVLTGYWKHMIIFFFDIQCFFQRGSECGSWIKIIENRCLVIQKIHLDFLWFILFSI